MNYSVGIPVKNEENTLEKCIISSLNQTITPKEILVCINGSSDSSYEIAKSMSTQEKRIKVLTSPPGKPNAWNKIVKSSQNNYIQFTDGDVKINKFAAEKLFEVFKKNQELAIVGGTFTYLKPQNETLFSKFTTEAYDSPLGINFLSGRLYLLEKEKLSKLFEKEKIVKMPKEIINEDYFLGLIGNKYGQLSHSKQAYVECNPIQTFKDWFSTSKRIELGKIQIKENFPELFEKKDSRLDNYFERFSKIKENKKKIGLISLFVTRNLINAYLKTKDNHNYSNLWKSPTSTKTAFLESP